MSARLDIVTNDAGELVRREYARDLGAGVVVAIYRLVKLAQLHDLANQAFVRQLDQTHQLVSEYCLRSGTNVNVLFAHKAAFVAGQLLKGSRGTYEAASELGALLERLGGSELFIARDVGRADLLAFGERISACHRTGAGFESPSPKIRLRSVTDAARMRGVEFEDLSPDQRIVRTYASAIVVLRRFFEDLAAGRLVLPRRLKRIAQSLVDLSDERTASFLGVTEARNANHDEAGRATNTAILAVAMARELTHDRATLAQIAMGAMMLDVARPRAIALAGGGEPALAGMQAPTAISADQEDRLAAGAAAVLTMLGRVNEPTIRRTVLTFEALWKGREAWIGPAYWGARPPTLHAVIVAVARRYNDLLTPEPGLAPASAASAVAQLRRELASAASASLDAGVIEMLVAALGVEEDDVATPDNAPVAMAVAEAAVEEEDDDGPRSIAAAIDIDRTIFQPEGPAALADDAEEPREPSIVLDVALAPTARGVLATTPLPHVLVYMLDHALTGTVVVGAEQHAVYFEDGVPRKARRFEGASALLGGLATLSNLPRSSEYAFYAGRDLLAPSRGRPIVLHPLDAILVSVRAWEDRTRIDDTLRRFGRHRLALHADSDVARAALTPEERTILASLRDGTATLGTLRGAAPAEGDAALSSFVYALTVTRQLVFPGQTKPPLAARIARPSLVEPEVAAGSSVAFDALQSFRLAEAALQRGDLDAAGPLAEAALAADPSQTDYVALAAWVSGLAALRAGGEAPPSSVHDAIRALSRALLEDPSNERALLARGRLLARSGRPHQARIDLEELLASDPQHAEALAELRDLERVLGEPLLR